MSAYNEDNIERKTLGRIDEQEVVLMRYLRPALKRLNPGFPESAYDDATGCWRS